MLKILHDEGSFFVMRKSALKINIIMLHNVNVLSRVAPKSCIQNFCQKNESELRDDFFIMLHVVRIWNTEPVIMLNEF